MNKWNDFFSQDLSAVWAGHAIKIKFALVGIWNTIFGYSVFYLLDTLFSEWFRSRSMAYMSAMALSNIIAICNAYIFHKYITFQSSVKGRGMVKEFIKFLTTYLFTIFLNLILLPIFVELLHFSPKIAALLVILICTVISYLGHSRFSFGSEKEMKLRP